MLSAIPGRFQEGREYLFSLRSVRVLILQAHRSLQFSSRGHAHSLPHRVTPHCWSTSTIIFEAMRRKNDSFGTASLNAGVLFLIADYLAQLRYCLLL